MIHPWCSLSNGTTGWSGKLWVLVTTSKIGQFGTFRLSICHVAASGHELRAPCAVLSTNYRLISHVFLAL